VSAGSSKYRPPILGDEDEHRTPSAHNLLDDTKSPDREQSQISHTKTGETLVKPNVRRFLEGAHFKRVRNRDDEDYTLEISPKGQSVISALTGTANEKGGLDPYTCSASRPGETEGDFHQLDKLDQGGQSFGSFHPGSGSVLYLGKGDDIDTEAKSVSGYAIDYVVYGQDEPAKSCS
jgi:hypothetical protein